MLKLTDILTEMSVDTSDVLLEIFTDINWLYMYKQFMSVNISRSTSVSIGPAVLCVRASVSRGPAVHQLAEDQQYCTVYISQQKTSTVQQYIVKT